MKRFFRRLRDHIYTSAGLYRLAEGFGFYALVHVCFQIFTNLQSVFINTLFIRLTGSSDSVMWYNMIVNMFCGPFMLLGAYIARRTSPTLSLKLGILFHIGMYLVFFATLDFLGDTMPVIAMLAGMGNGLYWFSYNYILNVYSTDVSRDLAVSLMGVLSGFVSLTMPTLAGLVISQFAGFAGYTVMFGFSLGVAVFTILIAGRMHPVTPEERHSRLRELIRLLGHSPYLCLSLAGEYCKCIREGICGFLFNVLLFEAVNSEAVVGLNTLLTGVGAILGAFTYGRLIGQKNRIRSMGISATLLLALVGALFWKLSPVTIVLYSVLNAVLGVYLMNPTFSLTYAFVQGRRESRAAMPEFIGVRECMVGLGRISGILFTMRMPESALGSVAAIAALTALQYITVLLFRCVEQHTPKKEEAAV